MCACVFAGFPDFFIYRPNHYFHGLAVEFKTLKGKLRKDQEKWLLQLRQWNFLCVIIVSVEQFADILQMFLTNNVELGGVCDSILKSYGARVDLLPPPLPSDELMQHAPTPSPKRATPQSHTSSSRNGSSPNGYGTPAGEGGAGGGCLCWGSWRSWGSWGS